MQDAGCGTLASGSSHFAAGNAYTIGTVKCDLCDNEATVHEVSVQGGRQVDRHLCERCAASRGLVPPRSAQPVQQIVIQAVVTQGGPGQAEAGRAQSAACEGCGQTFAQFRQSGLMGCPRCYAAFEGQLGPLLSRAHEGGTHHVGKTPRSAAGEKAPAGRAGGASAADASQASRARAAALRKQLAEAVASEQYERAAALRDELRALEQAGGAPTPGGEAERGAGRVRRGRPAQGAGESEPEGT
jgi:protein arginine kinase activator